MIEIKTGKLSDFIDINDLTRQAISTTFYCDGLTESQIEDNERVVHMTRAECEEAAVHPKKIVLIAWDNDIKVGFVLLNKIAKPCPEFDWIMILPNYQGRGVAQALMDASLNYFDDDHDIQLNVLEFNHRAIGFYEKYGFKRIKGLMPNRVMPTIEMIKAAS